MAFDPKKITRAHILSASKRAKKEKQNEKPLPRWVVAINGDRYSAEKIMRYAHQEMNDEAIWETYTPYSPTTILKQFNFPIIDNTPKNDPIKPLIAQYKSHLKTEGLGDHVDKWIRTKKFHGCPDVNVGNFKAEFNHITYDNFVYSTELNEIRELVDKRPETLRKAFAHLFDESVNLSQRVNDFSGEIKRVFHEIYPNKIAVHFQNELTISTYLAYHNSLLYAFYKYSFYERYCQLKGKEIKPTGQRYTHYLSLLDDFIADYINEDSELLDLKNQFLTPDCFSDKNNKILAQDILQSTLGSLKRVDRHIGGWRPRILHPFHGKD